MKHLLNAMRLQAQLTQDGRAVTRIGIVSSYDPDNYCAKVRIMPEDAETGWLPVTSAWVGNGWGMFCPPTPGDQVEVEFQEGDFNAGFVVGRFFTDVARPLSTPAGEFWLAHKSGSSLKFLNSGDVELHTARDLNASVARNMNATVTGNAGLAVSGNITSSAAQWNHTGPLTVNGPITGTQGMAISGTYPSSSYSVSFAGVMQWSAVNINATGQMSFNGKRIDDTLRVSGVQPGSGTSGNPI